MEVKDYLVAFSTQTTRYCVGIVDIVGSSKTAAKLSLDKLGKYYELFLNSMSRIILQCGGVVVKNVGDSLMYYFPQSSKNRKFGFMCCLESCLNMIEIHKQLNAKLDGSGLPSLDYRVSADYGTVILMKANQSLVNDMIGPSVNMCVKINRHATTNNAVIGGDLYELVKNFNDYDFKKVSEYSIGLKHAYPVYSVTRKQYL